jgi:predicted phage tail protein|tara:strand:+ start:1412 stop:2293 length:882 start_codon:yes stop_codon:yes gene_type:complete
MRKVYLEGSLGKQFGEEWTLSVNTPAEAIQAIMAQRPGMRKFLVDSDGIEGYEVLIDNASISVPEELLLSDPGQTQSYTFVPVIAGSKSPILTMIIGAVLIYMTAGAAAAFGAAGQGAAVAGSTAAVGTTVQGVVVTQAMLTSAGTISLSGAATISGASQAAILAVQGAGQLGMGLLLGGAAMMLAPDVPDGSQGSKSENYLFGGPINTTKQGGPMPLVYGRAIVGSKTISASLFTNTSRQKLTAGRKMVGIPNFRTDGSVSGLTGASDGKGFFTAGAGGRGSATGRENYSYE